MQNFVDIYKKVRYTMGMDNRNENKIFPYVGQLAKKGSTITSFDEASPWKEANTSFYWTNFEYPLNHGHKDWELLIVLNGCIVNKINGTEHLHSAGEACLVGPKDTHALVYPKGVKNQFQGVTLIAKDSYLKALLGMYSSTLYDELLNPNELLYFSLSPNFLEKCTNLLFEIQTFENQSTPYTEQQCNLIFSNILLKMLEQRRADSGIPTILKDFVLQLNNPLITSQQIKLAQQNLPYSYPQLTRIFKKYMHCTITQYVNKVKLQHAKDLIANTDMTLTEIINELDFESISYFHKIFKQAFDITPIAYRKQNVIKDAT